MAPEDREVLRDTLDALERLMRMFQVERMLYLVCCVVSFGLLVYAGVLMFQSKGVGATELGIMFGATGLTSLTGGRIIYFLDKSFNLISDIVRKLSGLG